MTKSQITMIAAMAVYLLAMLVIGAIVSKRNKNSGDFYLGGRKLGSVVTAMSAEASDMSGWLLLGLPGVAYLSGIAEAFWTALGLAVGTYFNWLIVAKPLRRYSEKVNAITIPQFFNNRFRDKTRILMGVSAVIIIVFFIPYTASGFNACGTLFSSLFGINYLTAMIVSAAVILIYTMLGGFLAASITDLIQSIVMTVALIIVVFFGINSAGGAQAVVENGRNMISYFSLTSTYDYANNASTGYGFITIASTLAWGLGYFGMPHILLRFMAVKSEDKLKTSRRIATIWVVISMGIAIFIGFTARAMSASGSISDLTSGGSTTAQTAIIKIAELLSRNNLLLAVVAGIILSGILACTMSTADSQMLAASSSISQDIVQGVFKIKLSEKKSILIARLTLLFIAVVGVIWARREDSVFSIVSFAWAGFGAAFGPVVLFSLFWKRTNAWGALAGMLSGGATVFIWKYLVRPLGGGWDIYELLPAFLVACIFIIIVSCATKSPSEEIIAEFEEVREKRTKRQN